MTRQCANVHNALFCHQHLKRRRCHSLLPDSGIIFHVTIFFFCFVCLLFVCSPFRERNEQIVDNDLNGKRQTASVIMRHNGKFKILHVEFISPRNFKGRDLKDPLDENCFWHFSTMAKIGILHHSKCKICTVCEPMYEAWSNGAIYAWIHQILNTKYQNTIQTHSIELFNYYYSYYCKLQSAR